MGGAGHSIRERKEGAPGSLGELLGWCPAKEGPGICSLGAKWGLEQVTSGLHSRAIDCFPLNCHQGSCSQPVPPSSTAVLSQCRPPPQLFSTSARPHSLLSPSQPDIAEKYLSAPECGSPMDGHPETTETKDGNKAVDLMAAGGGTPASAMSCLISSGFSWLLTGTWSPVYKLLRNTAMESCTYKKKMARLRLHLPKAGDEIFVQR